MRPHTLEILQKVHKGTLEAHRARDIEAAAPLIIDYVRHNTPLDPVILEALFQARIKQAQATGIPHQDRADYWRTITEIYSEGRHNNRRLITEWVLEKFETMDFKLFSSEEMNQNRQEQEAYCENPVGQTPVVYPSRSSIYHDAYWIMKNALEDLDQQTMMRAVHVIQNHFEVDLNESLKYRSELFSYRTGDLSLNKGTPEETVAYYTRLLELADIIDHEFPRANSRFEIIGACFVPALGTSTPKIVQDFFIAEAGKLTLEKRAKIFQSYSHASLAKENRDFPCRTSFHKIFMSAVHMQDRAPLDHMERLAKLWKQPKIFRQLLENNLLERNYGRDDPFGYSFFSKIESDFDPRLPWDEISYRLDKLRTFHKEMPDPKDLSNTRYLSSLVKRAIKFGHAEDLQTAFDVFKKFPQEQQDKLNEWHVFPFYDDRVSRDPETLQVLADNLPLSVWYNDRNRREHDPILSKLILVPPEDEDHWNYDNALCSYVSKGMAIPAQDRINGLQVLLPLIDRVMEVIPEDSKQDFINELYSKDDYRSHFKKTLSAIVSADRSDLAKMLFESMSRHMPEEEFKDRAVELGEEVLNYWYVCGQTEGYINFFRVIAEMDQLGPSVVKSVIDNSYSMNSRKREILCHFLNIERAKTGNGGRLWYLHAEIVDDYMQQVKTFSGSLDALENKCMKERGLYRGYFSSPNFSPALRDELLPLLQIIQREEGQERRGYAEEQAAKLATLFPSLRRADSFIRQHAAPGRQPVHDLCLFTLPHPHSTWDKEAWGNLAIRYGWPVLRYLGHAPGIENYVNNYNERRRQTNIKLGKAGKNLDDGIIDLRTIKPAMIRAIVNRVGYKNAAENKAAADFCLKLGVTEYAFDKAVTLIGEFKKSARKPDDTPDIHIDGASIGLDGYAMKKIPKGDIVGLFVGKMVNCCNHIDENGHASDMAIAQFNGRKNALYVVTDKKNRPVAKLSGWITEKGNLVFNAWERLSDEEDFLMSRFVLAAGIQALEASPKIKRVLLGAGPIKERTVPFKMADKPEKPDKTAEVTRDSEEQFVVASRDSTLEAKNILQKEIQRALERGDVRVKATYEEREHQRARRNHRNDEQHL